MLTPNASHFPKLMKYIETLPFKSIGRVLLFTAYPNAPVCTHRDSIVAEHKDHNINLFFTGGDRSSYIWDATTDEKIYLVIELLYGGDLFDRIINKGIYQLKNLIINRRFTLVIAEYF